MCGGDRGCSCAVLWVAGLPGSVRVGKRGGGQAWRWRVACCAWYAIYWQGAGGAVLRCAGRLAVVWYNVMGGEKSL